MKKKISLRSQIFIVLIFFAVFVLGLIFVFQNFFLDDFYKNNKIKIIERTGDSIANNLNNDDFKNYLENLTFDEDVCIRIISSGVNITGVSQRSACPLVNLSNYQMNEIANETQENGNAKLFDNYKLSNNDKNNLYIYSKLASTGAYKVLILVSSIVTPLTATVATINNQYLVIIAIVILATLLLALFLSKIILKPIKNISSEAKMLPEGKYNSDVIKTNALEIENLNNTLKEANQEILKAGTAKKELLANVTHDLRTPLTMIVGYGEMVRDFPEENNSENIDVIIDEAKRLSSLVDDLIDVSRYEEKGLELNKTNISLNELLNAVYRQYEKYCENLNVEFKLKTLKDYDFVGDEKRIKQVLYNFINNSLNYNTKKKKKITLGVEKQGTKHRVYVLDNGEGIDKDDLEKIWDRYYKVDKEHKRFHLGSGIGLSLARDILVSHDFNYGVESEVKKYTKFYFDV